MKKILLILALATPAFSANFYFSQSGGGAGTSCGSTFSVAQFNANVSSWAAAGNTAHLCGTITTALVVPAGGSNVSPVTIQWESGALVNVCSGNGAVEFPGLQWVVADMGANSPAVECTGGGQAANNIAFSDGGARAQGPGMQHIEIRNGGIGPLASLAFNPAIGDYNVESYGLTCAGCNFVRIHNATFTQMAQGAYYLFGQNILTTGSNEFDHNTCGSPTDSTVGKCATFDYGQIVTATDTGSSYHDNLSFHGNSWSASGMHIEDFQSFSYGVNANTKFVHFLVYNNEFRGTYDGGTSATIVIYLGLADDGSHVSTGEYYIFNNLIHPDSILSHFDGLIFEQDDNHTLFVFNNTVDTVSNASDPGAICLEFEGGTHSTIQAANNLCLNPNTAVYNANTTGPVFTGWSNNDYYNVGTSGVNGWVRSSAEYLTLANWQANCACGGDVNSIISNPNVNSAYVPQTGSPVIGAGINLNSVCSTVPQLCFDKAGAPRPVSTAWTIGAFQAATGPNLSNSPTTINFGNQQTGTSSAAQAVTVTNLGSSPASSVVCSITGTNANQFSITDPGNCPATLSNVSGSNTFTIHVQFSPNAIQSNTANFTVSFTGGSSSTILSGSGTPTAPSLSNLPTSIAFGNQPDATSSAAQNIVISNTGTGGATITSCTLTGANPTQFTLAGICPATLSNGP